jgi:hypothetical protein
MKAQKVYQNNCGDIKQMFGIVHEIVKEESQNIITDYELDASLNCLSSAFATASYSKALACTNTGSYLSTEKRSTRENKFISRF